MKRKTVTGGGKTPLVERTTDHGPSRAYSRRLQAANGNVIHHPETGGKVPTRGTHGA